MDETDSGSVDVGTMDGEDLEYMTARSYFHVANQIFNNMLDVITGLDRDIKALQREINQVKMQLNDLKQSCGDNSDNHGYIHSGTCSGTCSGMQCDIYDVD